MIIILMRGGDGNMKSKNIGCFRFFTVDSNILAAVVCAVIAVCEIKALVTGETVIPEWALIFKLVGSTAVALTFFVVIFLLSRIYGFKTLYEGTSFIMHLVAPVFAMASLMFFDGGGRISYIGIVFSLIPSVIYGAVYFYMVVIKGENRGGWADFYGFNAGGKWYITAPAIIFITGVLAFLLTLVHNLIALG